MTFSYLSYEWLSFTDFILGIGRILEPNAAFLRFKDMLIV